MAVAANTGHGTRVWQSQIFALLKLTKEESSLNSGSSTKGWSFDLAVQPYKRFSNLIHTFFISYLIYYRHGYDVSNGAMI